ncbi:A1pp-domain-containing protein [Schizopora paradoxa]|uniref:A1pp-domain-containing protein n=1 Tax=Schizopora paradoxa TaxID=27342 RepID=A0A0H2RQL4_9AGAM|nr:A1pp-domain-containing protein [Schizopora paradoxa]
MKNSYALSEVPTIRDMYERGVLKSQSHVDTVSIFQGDITKLNVDVIVNAAKADLLGGKGVDGAIHAAAGPQLRSECRKLKGCSVGDAKITNGYELPAKYVIHTVGPIYSSRHSATCQNELASCYLTCLELAVQHGLRTVAFPAISTGIYGYPLEEATHVALASTRQFLYSKAGRQLKRVVFVAFDDKTNKVYESLIPQYFPYSN